MKKSVLFIALLLVMTNFVIALHPCEGDDESINGVYIDGECFNCGNNDGICPENFGADCVVPDIDCVSDTGEPDAPFWSLDGTTIIPGSYIEIDLLEGEDLVLIVPDTGLTNGEKLDMDIYENDPYADDYITTIEGTVNAEGTAVASYEIAVLEDINNPNEGSEKGDLALYFESQGRRSFDLTINLTIGQLGGIETCSEYANNITCEENLGEAAVLEGAYLEYDQQGPNCLRRESMVGCEWNYTTETCSPAPSVIEYHPDNDGCTITATSCKYTESGNTECGAGDEFFQVSYTSDDPSCKDWTTTAIPCPQELKVPFFGTYAFITTLSLISLIYVYLIFRKK